MKRLIYILALFASMPVFAQGLLTTIVGEVYDADTREPLQAVSVYIKGTSVGTATTLEGIFLLRTQLDKKAVMVVSAVGYEQQQYDIKPGMSAGIDVALKESRHELEEVFVLPGSNPALALMDSVRKYRRVNKSEPDGSLTDSRLDVSVSRFSAKQLKRRFWKSMQGAMRYTADSTLVLPVYSRTTQQGQQDENVYVLTDNHWKILLSDYDAPPSFYSNTFAYLGTSFLSPLASDGNHYYKYLLVDSIGVADKKTYKVQFYTKNPYYPTFNGELQLDSSTYALTYIRAEVPSEVSVNYLQGLTIEQWFRCSDSGKYVPQAEDITMLLDFDVKLGKTDIFPSLLIKSVSAFDKGETMQDRSNDSITAAVEQAHTDTLLADIPIMRVATFAAQVIQTAYIPTGTFVDIGKVTEIIHVNPIETVRLGLPLRTNARFSKDVCLEAYASYGFGDKKWKGEGKIQWRLPTERRNILSLCYSDKYIRNDVNEMMQLKRENSMWFSDMNVTMHLVQMFMQDVRFSHSMSYRRELSLMADLDLSPNVETRFGISAGDRGYRFSKANALVRVGWQERKVDMYFQRVHVYSNLPVLYFYGEMGSVQRFFEKSYDVYGKLAFMLYHEASLGMYGRLNYRFEGGVVIGDVPYDMMHTFEGNQSYAYEPTRFTLLAYNEAYASRYLTLQADWNGKGCLFNRIPWVQRLRLTELAEVKLAYGGDLKVPYAEIGVGIGNILRFGELYAVWRLSHFKDMEMPWWGIRFRLHIE